MAVRKSEDPQPDVASAGELVPAAPGAVGPIAKEPPPSNEPPTLDVAEPVVAEYTGPRDSDGTPRLFFTGIPAGDLTASTWDALTDQQQDLVTSVKGDDGKPLYRMATATQRQRDQRRAQHEAAQQLKKFD